MLKRNNGMSPSKSGVLVVGSANMDLVITADRFPAAGETVFGSTFTMYPGGKGANQAVACAKLGQQVYFLGKIGNDSFGERLAGSLADSGVRLDALKVEVGASTGIAHITVDRSGQNQIIVISGSNMLLTPEDVRAQEALVRRTRVMLVQLEIPLPTATAAILLAHQHGGTVILNPAPAQRLPRALLAGVDFLTPNETELHMLTNMPVTSLADIQRAARALLATGLRNVLVTLGPRGSLLVNHDGTRLYPTRRVKAVDTTAAGDAFNGALACALARCGTVDEAVHLANTAATFSVTRRGAQSSMPTTRDLRKFLPHAAFLSPHRSDTSIQRRRITS
jgi:ribokinase